MGIGVRAIERLLGHDAREVNATWYAFAVVGIVIVIDITRTVVSLRASHRYQSAALAVERAALRKRPRGLVRRARRPARRARAGYANGDSIAALFVAVLVLVAAARLMRGNVDVLMDRAPTDAEAPPAPRSQR